MKRVLLTGSNGFLGRALRKEMSNCLVDCLDIKEADLSVDLSKEIPDLTKKYDVVIHCAGKAHSVPKTETEKRAFFDVNYLGTKNLCQGLDRSDFQPGMFVLVSSVSVYGREFGENIKEEEFLNGKTPYARSKIQAEEFVRDWAVKNSSNYLILRLPLIVSDFPPGNLGKMINAIKKRQFFKINGGLARKSMVVASDLSNLIFTNTDKSGIYNLTDGKHPSFYELEELITKKYGLKTSLNLPLSIAKLLAIIGEVVPFFPFNQLVLRKMTYNLTFDDSKAQKELEWKPTPVKEIFNHLKY